MEGLDVTEACCATLLELATQDNSATFLGKALAAVRTSTRGGYAGLVEAERGRWTVLAEDGRTTRLPTELLAEALDGERVVTRDQWTAAPLSRGGQQLLLLSGNGQAAQGIDRLAQHFGQAWKLVRQRQRAQDRSARLEAMLEIAASWRQTLAMDELLAKIAEAATGMLSAERASIFLWDRRTHTLVGRPALGVEGGELRIADDTGVVGQVVQSGEPARVDEDLGQEQIDRAVDRQLNFKTRTLLCVPLRGASGELFGAFEMINKRGGNFTADDEVALTELARHAALALESTQQYEQLLDSRNRMADQAAQGVQLIGNCPAIEALRSTIRRVADTELAVLILGENGTGKEVISQMIHYLSRRRAEPLVAVNCAALTESLLESELFGHEKGAFTDARETRVGKFELASGGTLFLDEIGEMSAGGQAKLLRVLEEKVVVRVGGSQPIATDARVIAATNQNLAELVRQKRFREDLYYRLNVVTLELPALRDRGEDILELAEHFLVRFCADARRRPPAFTAAARKRLLRHNWPGNVRELRNLMERLAYLSAGDKVDADDLAFILDPEPDATVMSSELPLGEATRKFQIQYIQKHIQRARGNMTEAAERLGLHRSNLYRKMRQLDMDTDL